jgi:mycoredoxin
MFTNPVDLRNQSGQNSQTVTVFGTTWCAQTQMVRRFLDRSGIPYTFRDMDRDAAAADQVRWWTGGYASHPTVQVGGEVLIEPSINELQAELANKGML